MTTPPITWLDTVDSTNEEARRRWAAGDVVHPEAIVAAEQTAGRGTRGRSWSSPPAAGLYCSLLLPGGVPPLARREPDGRPAAPPVDTLHTLAAGVAVAGAVTATFGVDVGLKPVNDVLVDGRKLAGVLVESVVRGGRLEALVVGVGINLARADRPVAAGALKPVCIEEVRPPGHPVREDERRALVHTLLEGLLRQIDRAVGADEEGIKADWRRLAVPGAEWPRA